MTAANDRGGGDVAHPMQQYQYMHEHDSTNTTVEDCFKDSDVRTREWGTDVRTTPSTCICTNQTSVPNEIKMNRRELARLQVHNPCDGGTEIGVFASPQLRRRSSGTCSARIPSKKRARLPAPGEVSKDREDVLVPTQEILEQQVSALRREVMDLRVLIYTTFHSALSEITHRSAVPPSPVAPRP